jgi:surfactin synthase thioesterase subunit
MARLTDQPLHRLAPLLTELAGRSATYRAGATALYKRQYGMYLTYQYHDEPLLDCPVSTFTGRDDPIGPAGVQHEWDPLTTSWSRHRVYPGRHFYLTDHWPDVAGNLAHDLGGAVG